ncbi:MAG: helix-turn-helix domain-containing protein [Sphingorhabdus sp.]
MSKKFIPASVLFAEWHKDSEYMKEYDALEEEFARAQMVIGARTHADLSQAELAQRMGTSQSAIARLESGRVKPSTRTLEKLAAATGMRLRIVLEPVGVGS